MNRVIDDGGTAAFEAIRRNVRPSAMMAARRLSEIAIPFMSSLPLEARCPHGNAENTAIPELSQNPVALSNRPQLQAQRSGDPAGRLKA